VFLPVAILSRVVFNFRQLLLYFSEFIKYWEKMKLLTWLLLFGFLIAFVYAQGETSSEDSSEDSTDSGEDSSETDSGEDDTGGDVTTAAPVEINDNDVVSNYYYSTFADTYSFPYAVGHCTASGIDGASYLMAECNNDDDTITVSEYNEGTCSSPIVTNTYNSSLAVFKCDGEDHYVDMFIGITDCDGLEFHVIAALDVCVAGGLGSYVTVYCKDNYAELQYYGFVGCPAAALALTRSATDVCDTDGFLPLTGGTVYGIVSECSESGETEAPTSAASIHSTIVCLFIAAVAGVLKL
jgi:hypothetical protein